MPSDIAVYGLGVMGRNIALNMLDHGLKVTVFNRTAAVTETFMGGLSPGHQAHAAFDLAGIAASLTRPRLLFLMATAGPVVDRVIEDLLPHLDSGDVIIDGGNSFFRDTQRRWQMLSERDIRFLGMGISGGEEGARHGPSIMPGGDPEAWPLVAEMFQGIAARADDGQPCCSWIAQGGAGHYVKMIHNGIEYGDMQLIAEAWHLMRDGLGMPAAAIATTFESWNRGPLSSYLIEITADILSVTEHDGSLRLDHIVDAAGQKGTGRWTVIDALEMGTPLTLIAEAVFARSLSAMREERGRAAARLGGLRASPPDQGDEILDAIRDALYAAKIISYTQGFMQMRMAADEHGWRLAFADIALLWRAGCIIRSRFLDAIAGAYRREPELPSLLFDDYFSDAVKAAEAGWRRAVALGVQRGIALPAMSAALSFYDGYRNLRSPASLLQAQRDYFGAHSYQRLDRHPDSHWHTHWSDDRREVRIDE